MIVMTFTIELDIGRSFLLQHETTHRRGRSKRSYGHCRRRNEIPEAEPPTGRGPGGTCHTWKRMSCQTPEIRRTATGTRRVHRPMQASQCCRSPDWLGELDLLPLSVAIAGQYGPVSKSLHRYDERVDVESACPITRSIALFVAEWAVAGAR
jgi:hypothetical protein